MTKRLLFAQVSLVLTLAACQAQTPTGTVQQTPAQTGNIPASSAPAAQPGTSATTPSGLTPGSSDSVKQPTSTLRPGNQNAATAPSTTTPAAPVAPAQTQVLQASNYNTETVIAGLRTSASLSDAQAIAQRHGLTVKTYMDSIRSVVYTTQGQAVPALLNALKAEAALEFVEADQVSAQQPNAETAVGGFSLLSEDSEEGEETETNDPAEEEEGSTDETPAEPAVTAPKDTYYADQYSLSLIKAQDAWKIVSTSEKAREAAVANEQAESETTLPEGVSYVHAPINISVIDAGVQTKHADFGAVATGNHFDAYSRAAGQSNGEVSSLNLFKSSYKQGTHTAGILSAVANDKGIIGIANGRSKITAIKTAPDLWDKIKSLFTFDDAQLTQVSVLADAIVWAANSKPTANTVDLLQINNTVNAPSMVLKRAIEHAQSKGLLVVVPTGDRPKVDAPKTVTGPDTEYCINPRTGKDIIDCQQAADEQAAEDVKLTKVYNYLATLDGVVAVGAVDKTGANASFSPPGAYVSVVAPGVDVISTVPGLLSRNSYAKRSGTSVAASQVTGVLALMIYNDRVNQTPKAASWYKQQLQATAEDKGAAGFDNQFGHGLVNAYKALGGQ